MTAVIAVGWANISAAQRKSRIASITNVNSQDLHLLSSCGTDNRWSFLPWWAVMRSLRPGQLLRAFYTAHNNSYYLWTIMFVIMQIKFFNSWLFAVSRCAGAVEVRLS